MGANILDVLQGKNRKEARRIAETLARIPEKDLPSFLKVIKGFTFHRAGSLQDASQALRAVYDDDEYGIGYWPIINDFRIINHKSTSDDRVKILTNVTGGRIGLALMANCDVVSFIPGQGLGRRGPSRITYRPLKDSFMDIVGHLPLGWEPDYVFFFLSEVYPLPVGIEFSPFPVVGLPGDPWKFNKLSWDTQFFDALMPAIKHMCPAYEKLGQGKVLYTSCSGIQGYVPWAFGDHLHGPSEKDYDVVATGSLSTPFYRKRGGYLWRLLSLADRYRVFVGRTKSLEECYQLMARAKIVIHCPSIQGGVNLRPFEAIACGALLFHEEGDRAIEEFFEPGREIVLFNEGNFEEMIEYYLARDEERKKMIVKAMERNRHEGNIKVNMEKVVKKVVAEKISVSKRAALKWSESEKLNALGVSSFYARDIHQASTFFARAIQRDGNNGKSYNNLAVCMMVESLLGGKTQGITQELLLESRENDPSSAISRFNLLSLYAYVEPERQNFFHTAEHFIDDLVQRPHVFRGFQGDELILYLEEPVQSFPDSFVFRMELEFLLESHPDRGVEYQKKILQSLLWRTLEYVGDHYAMIDMKDEAIQAYSEALKYCQGNENILERLAGLYSNQGLLHEAEEVLLQLIGLSPLNEKAHLDLCTVEISLGKKKEMRERVSRLLCFMALSHRNKFEEMLSH